LTTRLPHDLVLDFDRLSRLTIIDGIMVNETPLRVGVGREAPLGSVADITVITMKVNGESTIFIPGSSIKGVLRSYVEQLVRTTEPDLHSPWDFEKMDREKEEGFCIVCGIFGNTQVASHVRVYDALPISRPGRGFKTGIGIDREFQAVKPGVLYTEEFVEPGCKWKFRMDIINITYPGEGDERSRFLGELFKALKDVGLQVGARKSVGMGLIKLEKASYKAYAVEYGSLKLSQSGEI